MIGNSAQAAHESQPGAGPYTGSHPIGTRVPVLRRDGASLVSIRGVAPSEALVLINR